MKKEQKISITTEALRGYHAQAIAFIRKTLNPVIAEYFTNVPENGIMTIDATAPQYIKNTQALLNLLLIIAPALPLYTGYTLHPLSELPNNNIDNIETGKIYLGENGEYQLRDTKGQIVKGSFKEIADANWADIDKKLEDPEFKARLLTLTASRGDTLPTNADGTILSKLWNSREWYNTVTQSLKALEHFNLETSPETFELLRLLRSETPSFLNVFSEMMPETSKLGNELKKALGSTTANAITRAVGSVTDYLSEQKQHESNRHVIENFAALSSPKLEQTLAQKDERKRYHLNPKVDGEIATALKGISNSLNELNDALSFNQNADGGKIISGALEGLLQYNKILDTIYYATDTVVLVTDEMRARLRKELLKFRPVIKEIILEASKREDSMGLYPGSTTAIIEPYARSYFQLTNKLLNRDLLPITREQHVEDAALLSLIHTTPLDKPLVLTAKQQQRLDKLEEDSLFLESRLRNRSDKLKATLTEKAKIEVLKAKIDRFETLLYTNTPLSNFTQEHLAELRDILPLLDTTLPPDLYNQFKWEIFDAIAGKNPIDIGLDCLKNLARHQISLQNQVLTLVKNNHTQIESYENSLLSQEANLLYSQIAQLLLKPIDQLTDEQLAFCNHHANHYFSHEPVINKPLSQDTIQPDELQLQKTQQIAHQKLIDIQAANSAKQETHGQEIKTPEYQADSEQPTQDSLVALNKDISARNINMSNLIKEARAILISNIDAYFSDTVVNNIKSSYAGYTLCLLCDLENKDPTHCVEGHIYLSETGEYYLRDAQGIVRSDSFKEIMARPLSNIELFQKRNDPEFKDRLVNLISKHGHTKDYSGKYRAYADDPSHIQQMKNFLSALIALEKFFDMGAKKGSYFLAFGPVLELKKIASQFNLNYQQQYLILTTFFSTNANKARSIWSQLALNTQSRVGIKTSENTATLPQETHPESENTSIFLNFYNQIFSYSEATYDYLNLEKKEDSTKLNLLPYAKTLLDIRDRLEKTIKSNFEANIGEGFARSDSGFYTKSEKDSPATQDTKTLLNTLTYLSNATVDIDTFLNGTYLDLIPALNSISIAIKSLDELKLAESYLQIRDIKVDLTNSTKKLITGEFNPLALNAIQSLEMFEQSIGFREGVCTHYASATIDFIQAQCDNIGIDIEPENDNAFLALREQARTKLILAANREEARLENNLAHAQKSYVIIKKWKFQIEKADLTKEEVLRLLKSLQRQMHLMGSQKTQSKFSQIITILSDNVDALLSKKDERLNEQFRNLRKHITIRHRLLKANLTAADKSLNHFRASTGFAAEVAEEHQITLDEQADIATQAENLAEEAKEKAKNLETLLLSGDIERALATLKIALNEAKIETTLNPNELDETLATLKRTLINNKIKTSVSQQNIEDARNTIKKSLVAVEEIDSLLKKAHLLAKKSHRGATKRAIVAAQTQVNRVSRKLEMTLNPIAHETLKENHPLRDFLLSILRGIAAILDAVVLVFRTLVKMVRPPEDKSLRKSPSRASLSLNDIAAVQKQRKNDQLNKIPADEAKDTESEASADESSLSSNSSVQTSPSETPPDSPQLPDKHAAQLLRWSKNAAAEAGVSQQDEDKTHDDLNKGPKL